MYRQSGLEVLERHHMVKDSAVDTDLETEWFGFRTNMRHNDCQIMMNTNTNDGQMLASFINVYI